MHPFLNAFCAELLKYSLLASGKDAFQGFLSLAATKEQLNHPADQIDRSKATPGSSDIPLVN